MYQLLADIWAAVTLGTSLLRQILSNQAAQAKAIQSLSTKLDQVLNQVTPKPAVKLILIAEVDGNLIYGVTKMNITDSQNLPLSIQPVDAKGNPAQLDGAPVWKTSNDQVIKVTPAADGLSCVASAVGPLGTATVSVTGDGDLGAGVTQITGSLDITVVGGGAVNITIVPGTPTEQTPPPPPPPPPPTV